MQLNKNITWMIWFVFTGAWKIVRRLVSWWDSMSVHECISERNLMDSYVIHGLSLGLCNIKIFHWRRVKIWKKSMTSTGRPQVIWHGMIQSCAKVDAMIREHLNSNSRDQSFQIIWLNLVHRAWYGTNRNSTSLSIMAEWMIICGKGVADQWHYIGRHKWSVLVHSMQ